MGRKRAVLALEDGSYFIGYAFGAEGTTGGELVFNTAMTGYQEILTDPSYKGQIVVMTYTQIGNYGVNAQDVESDAVQVNGFVVKEAFSFYSNPRAEKSLHEYLKEYGVVGIEGIDTRALVKKIRERGTLKGVISTEGSPEELVKAARALPDISELSLVDQVATDRLYFWKDGKTDRPPEGEGPLIAVIDFGVKFNILRLLAREGARVAVVPPSEAEEAIKELEPDALFFSNGPGDPERAVQGIRLARRELGKRPLMGICLGCQILALALGGRTYKLKFGHHGANHPVKDLRTGKVEITSQNHNFAVDPASLPKGVEVTHLNLLDNTVEGIRLGEEVFAVQYHPEDSPGPHDSFYLFKEFVRMAER
ncbi:MAG: glutamine-hydrolyzing carbamoyl-phosphate synthase small subunit [Aquificae bacterium]|nr:glutamine-hydrolyzing carbamoyl-phosphate synthase small subunit [Aquificota bacterium]